MRSSHIHRRGTLVNSLRVRHTAAGYAVSKANALVASAVTSGKTNASKGKVMRPPPPASELIAPAIMAAIKKKT
jgi:hypothetical protein